jgi:hypothetical protein
MKPIPIALVLLLLGPTAWAQNYPGGIVYGPKAAVNIAAPEGWVLDNQSGVEAGFALRSVSERIDLGGCHDRHVCEDCQPPIRKSR